MCFLSLVRQKNICGIAMGRGKVGKIKKKGIRPLQIIPNVTYEGFQAGIEKLGAEPARIRRAAHAFMYSTPDIISTHNERRFREL